MRSTTTRALLVSALAIAAAIAATGCAGDVTDGDDDGVVIDETESTNSALVAVDPSDDTGEPDDKADHDCDDKGADGHKRHRKHKFKMLDRMDGEKDGSIVIASLPAGLPERLLAKLARLDADGDGTVTKAEAKAWLKRKKDHHKGDRGDKGDRPRPARS